MNSQSNTCSNCGTPHREGARFCKECGQALSGGPPPSAKSQTRSPAGKPAARPAGAPNIPSIARAAPWQVAVGNEIPAQAIQALLRSTVQAAGGAARKALPARKPAQKGSSLRGPALQAFGGAALETITSALTGAINPWAAATKIGLALLNLIAGFVAGERRGVASILMLLASGGLALLQGGSLLGTLLQLITSPSLYGELLPGGVTQGLSFLAAGRAAIKCLQK